MQGAFQRCRDLRGILDPLSVATGGLADQLVLERLGQRRNREVVGLHRVTIGVGAPGRALHGVPDAVVPHDGQNGQALRVGHDVTGGAGSEDVGPIADAADHSPVTVSQLRPQRRANPPAQAAGYRNAEKAARLPDVYLHRVDAQFVQHDGVVVQHVGQAPGEPGFADGCPIAGGGGLLQPAVSHLVVATLPCCETGSGSRRVNPNFVDRIHQRLQDQPGRAGKVQVDLESSHRIAGKERIIADADHQAAFGRLMPLWSPGHVGFENHHGVRVGQRRSDVRAGVQGMVPGEVRVKRPRLEHRHSQQFGQFHQRGNRPGVLAATPGDQDGIARPGQRAGRLPDGFRRGQAVAGLLLPGFIPVGQAVDLLGQHLPGQG